MIALSKTLWIDGIGLTSVSIYRILGKLGSMARLERTGGMELESANERPASISSHACLIFIFSLTGLIYRAGTVYAKDDSWISR